MAVMKYKGISFAKPMNAYDFETFVESKKIAYMAAQ